MTIHKPKTYQSEAFAALYEAVDDAYKAGVIDKKTMRRFDTSCLTPVRPFSGEEIRQLRESEEVSQAVFARYMGVTKDAVSQWERGIKRPSGTALKLLSLVKHKGLSAIT